MTVQELIELLHTYPPEYEVKLLIPGLHGDADYRAPFSKMLLVDRPSTKELFIG